MCEQRVEKLEKDYVRIYYSIVLSSCVIVVLYFQEFYEKELGSKSETFRGECDAIGDES